MGLREFRANLLMSNHQNNLLDFNGLFGFFYYGEGSKNTFRVKNAICYISWENTNLKTKILVWIIRFYFT